MTIAAAALMLAATLPAGADPAPTSSVGTWWHWMNGHVTREGITKDLEAMRRAGVRNATIFNAHRPFGSQFTAVAPGR